MDNKELTSVCFNECPYGNCCTAKNGMLILGPVSDPHRFLSDLAKKYGRSFTWDEVFIGYDEGKELFKDSGYWQEPAHYPAMRVKMDVKDNPCVFYNTHIKACTVYDIRPEMCRTYGCDFFHQRKSEIM